MKTNTAKQSNNTNITTAEKYFGSIQPFPMTQQTKRYLACLGKAYDLREMFTRAIQADKTALRDCSSEVFNPLDVVIFGAGGPLPTLLSYLQPAQRTYICGNVEQSAERRRQMIYELTQDGYRLGLFPTEAEAWHHAAYMPKGSYTIREWGVDGEYLTFDPTTNTVYEFNN